MSDLHCPATLLVVPHVEAEQLRDLSGAARVAAVESSSGAPVVRAAEALAARLAVPLASHDRLDAAQVAAIADRYRGETVLVIAETAEIEALLPRSAPGGRSRRVVELLVDADGWVVRPWRGADAGTP